MGQSGILSYYGVCSSVVGASVGSDVGSGVGSDVGSGVGSSVGVSGGGVSLPVQLSMAVVQIVQSVFWLSSVHFTSQLHAGVSGAGVSSASAAVGIRPKHSIRLMRMLKYFFFILPPFAQIPAGQGRHKSKLPVLFAHSGRCE